MPTLKLNEKTISKLKAPDPSGKQVLHWDADLKGFGVVCSGSTNAKTYVVQHGVAGGLKRRVTVGKCNVLKLADARERAKEILADFFKGIDPKGGRNDKCTLRMALEDYLAARKNLAPGTRKNYRNRVEAYLHAWLDLPLRVITPEMVEQRHRKIAAESRRSGHATANDAMTMLKILWRHTATAVPTLPRNPTDRLKGQWFAEQRRTGIVKADDLPKFYAAVMALDDEVVRDYIRLLLFTGMRRSEAASLRWTDLDFTAKIIRVPGERTKTKTKLHLPMTDVLFGLFLDRRNRGKESEFIFPPAKDAKQIDPRRAFDRISADCGVEITAHDLRRTFLTVAESCEISQLALKALANHSLGNDVTAGYVMMTAQRLAAPAQKVADRMRELCGIAKVQAANVKRLRGA